MAIRCLILVLVFGMGLSGGNAQTTKRNAPQSAEAGGNLPSDQSSLFAASGTCVWCHSSDGRALVDSQGSDVSMVRDWRSSMMANALHDPIYQATVEFETSLRPGLQSLIEDKCLTCHSPMARTQALHDGASSYTLEEARVSGLATDGVSCTLCHQIQPDNLGTEDSWSGHYIIGEDRVLFGPYDNMQDAAMQGTVNFSSQFGAHKQTSEVCATCHTLFTPTLDTEGNIVGSFPEQTAYLEWKNSVYDDGPNPTTCQECHMPRINDNVLISIVPMNLSSHTPFWKHHLVGGNVFLLDILKNNIGALNLTASTEDFTRTLERTSVQLQKAVDIQIEKVQSQDDVTSIVISVTNQTGHKMATGFPSRRSWIHLKVMDASDRVVFESGSWNPSGEIVDLDDPYEPHYDVISQSDQVQIYENVMADLDGKVTFVLLNAASYVKDNRIPPKGFSSTGPYTEHTATKGSATTDPNFNRLDSTDGTGGDQVTYVLSTAGATYPLKIEAQFVYQSISPRFAEHLFTGDSPAIDRFETLYRAADNQPFVIASIEHTITQESPTLWLLR